MASHTKSTLDGLFKDVYVGKLESLIPDFGILMKKIAFESANKTGRDYVKSVKLTNEQGFTYGAGIQTLAGIISSDVGDAKVQGNALTLQTGFSYDAAANMASSKGAFIDATKFKFMAMMEAAACRLEAQMLYGDSGLGVSDNSTNTSTVITVIDFTAASWAPGLWSGQEGATIDFHKTADGVKLNTTGVMTIDSIDHVNKALTVSGATGDISAIDTHLSTLLADIYYAGSKGNEMVGLKSIVSNTGSLYGINGATYSLWAGNSSAVGGNLTLKKIYDGQALAVSKGLMEEVVVLVSPATYAVLANDQASLRRYNAKGDVKDAANGAESVEFYGQNGKISIVPHPMVKEGEALSFPIKKAARIGATDLTFNTPGKGDEMFQQLASQTGYECRLYSEQSIFLPCPAKGVLFTGVTN